MSQVASSVYAVAYGLVGFRAAISGKRVTSLRVRIERQDAFHVWVRTADIRDSGTPLVLSPNQIELEPQWVD